MEIGAVTTENMEVPQNIKNRTITYSSSCYLCEENYHIEKGICVKNEDEKCLIEYEKDGNSFCLQCKELNNKGRDLGELSKMAETIILDMVFN